MVHLVMRKIKEDFEDGWKKMKTNFQVQSARLYVSTEDELLQRSSDLQNTPGKSSTFSVVAFRRRWMWRVAERVRAPM